MRPDDLPAVVAIVRDLPEYFTDDVPDKVPSDFRAHRGWVLEDAGVVMGFAVVAVRPPAAAEILWMAVAPDRRGRGLGTALVDALLGELTGEGVAVVEAKTLDASAGYEPYVATRAFWEGRGFVHVDSIDPLPGWPPGNPAAIHVAALRATRPL
jgi:GNAT superfamily N-acetyltransferase